MKELMHALMFIEIDGEQRPVLNAEDAMAVIDHRKITIKKPLTLRGAKNLARQFALVDDPTAAVDMMIDKAWRGFNAEWYFNSTGGVPTRMLGQTAQMLEMAGKVGLQ